MSRLSSPLLAGWLLLLVMQKRKCFSTSTSIQPGMTISIEAAHLTFLFSVITFQNFAQTSSFASQQQLLFPSCSKLKIMFFLGRA